VIEAMLEELARAEIAIADVSTRNANVFYELGIAHMLKESSKVIILSQSIDDLPFDVRHYRCILYLADAQGLELLKASLVAAFSESVEDSFVLRAASGERMVSERLLFGPDRYMYTFSISELFVAKDAAKFRLTVERHAPGVAAVRVHADNYGISLREDIEMPHTGWRLVLEHCDPPEKAVFRGSRLRDSSGTDAAADEARESGVVTRVGEGLKMESIEDIAITGMRLETPAPGPATTEVLKGGALKQGKGVRIVGVEIESHSKDATEKSD
jgi:hypothetical protein